MTCDLRRDLRVAVAAAAAAREIHVEGRGRDLHVDSKSVASDLVTQIDREAEAAIRDAILAAFPGDAILGEEGGARCGVSGRRWIVDPLDGTLNYAHGLPWYCVSIALEIDGVVELGVVQESVRGELFSAIRGQGAFCDGRRIHVTSRARLEESMLATGFAYRVDQMMENVAVFARVMPMARAVRRPGSAAIELASVAAGRLDGYWEMYLSPWDVAAGALLVREAGGLVTDEHGDPHSLGDRVIVASNGLVHEELTAALGLGGLRSAPGREAARQ